MRTAAEIKQLPDADLLEYVCNVAGDEVAYSEFVNRYLPDTQTMCTKISGQRKLHVHVGLQISHDALAKFRGLKSFDRNKLKPPDDERKSINNLIYAICVNLFNDHHKKENRQAPEKQSFYLDEIFENAFVNGKTLDNARKKELTARLFKRINKKEQKLLLADMEYKKHQLYLPDHIVASLCEELEVTDSGLRKMRERIIKKFNKEIDVINGEQ